MDRIRISRNRLSQGVMEMMAQLEEACSKSPALTRLRCNPRPARMANRQEYCWYGRCWKHRAARASAS